MYGISGKLVKKYGIEGDLRAALLGAANEWSDAVGEGRTFMGGDEPNLADLSMFGVIRSITGRAHRFQETLIPIPSNPSIHLAASFLLYQFRD